MKKFSIVIPVYNNEANIADTILYLVSHLHLFSGYTAEIIMVCDGSKDRSYGIMEQFQEQYPDILRIACFTRNFGQGAAVRCGMEMADGDVIGVISCDLQDPPELFVEMLKKWEEGYPLVIAAREGREDGFVSAVCSGIFYMLVRKIVNADYPKGGFDMYLLDRCVARQFCQIDAPNGSTQMLLLWMGYDHCCLPYQRSRREKGKSGWSYRRKIDAAIGLFVTYSIKPVRWMEAAGAGMVLARLLGTVCCIVFSMITGSILWPGILLSGSCFFSGMILGAAGIVGEYVWRDFELAKRRPRYIIKKIQQKEI